jgi:hypothetical protein
MNYFVVFILGLFLIGTTGFVPSTIPSQNSVLTLLKAQGSEEDSRKQEAERLLAKARQLRSEIGDVTDTTTTNSASASSSITSRIASPWSVPSSSDDVAGEGCRLYVDIGREEGTWMDPRWGSSGKRIEFSLDVKFCTDILANETVAEKMVKDNFGGKSSNVNLLESASKARLRGGFDSMNCQGGGYRIDADARTITARFYIAVDGTPERGSSYGDVFVPQGCLYFSLPCFGGKLSQLSTKEGPITVRQIGWHTGFRRAESRIVGTFRSVPIADARRRDGF